MDYNVTLDYFLNNKVKALQYQQGYKSGIDSVLLASLVNAKAGDKLLDLGAGVGVISLCLLARFKNISVHAIDKNELFYKLLLQNIELNSKIIKHKNNTLTPLLDNILSWQPEVLFDKIICNPPYFKPSSTKSTSQYAPIRDFANIQLDAGIEDFINFSVKHLKNNGKFFVLYPANKLHSLLGFLNPKHWGGVSVYPIYSKKNNPSKRFIVTAVKNGNADSVLHSGITVHANQSYSAHAKSILYHGKDFFYHLNKLNK